MHTCTCKNWLTHLFLLLGECQPCFDAPPPSLFSVFHFVSRELIYVWFKSRHVRLDLASFSNFSPSLDPLHPLHALCLWYRRVKNILNTIAFYGLIKPLEANRDSKSDGEVERWGTEGPVWTRRHCVAPQLCQTDSLHYSTLQQPAPQSTANQLLTGPSGQLR